jgi:hypothetical protein
MMNTQYLAEDLTLELLPACLVVCKLSMDRVIPNWAQVGCFSAIVRTQDELSVVCEQQFIPPEVKAERGWRALKVKGPLDFTLKGILAAIALPLAKAGVSIFAISTFDTDYILVKEANLSAALSALDHAGHKVLKPSELNTICND